SLTERALYRLVLDELCTDGHHLLLLLVHGFLDHGVRLSLDQTSSATLRQRDRTTGTKEDGALQYIVDPLLRQAAEVRSRLTHHEHRVLVVGTVAVVRDVEAGHVVHRRLVDV